MSHAILITQCLQRDFVEPIPAYAPLPNLLHVGHEEAQRLMGLDPEHGPVAQVTRWAHAQPSEELSIVHIRDWHDAEDPSQQNHLRHFGSHCIGGTRGAELNLGIEHDESQLKENEHLVDALTLNDFEETTLPATLESLCARAKGEVRIGVVGVWTEAKVTFLLYELKTRLGIHSLATCSALTASASRSQHFNALHQLETVLGVRVFDSVGAFTSWLSPAGTGVHLPEPPSGSGTRLNIPEQTKLTNTDRRILGNLFRDSHTVQLDPLSGGFSGAAVFRATSRDAIGHDHAPSVVKLGSRELIGSERAAFERVEPILGNDAPSILGYVESGERAGLKYAYASMGRSDVQTFQSLYAQGMPVEECEDVLHAVFDEILGRFYRAAQYERLPLLDHYQFSAKWAPSVRDRVAAIMGEEAASQPTLEVVPGRESFNVCRFYDEFLPKYHNRPGEFHYVSYVHGDLNGANIIIDGRRNVWLIDFFHTARGHVLKDLAKLENDLLYIFTPVDEQTFSQAVALTDALRVVRDLRAPLPKSIPGVDAPELVRAWAVVRVLRGIVAKICHEDRHPLQMSIALLRYAVHTLGFDESDPWQRRWALAASCGWGQDVIATLDVDQRLRVDWVPVPGGGQLGLTLCPGRRDRGRDLNDDLDALSEQGANHLVSLLTHTEMVWAGVAELAQGAKSRGLSHDHFPIVDQSAPPLASAQELISEILQRMSEGQRVVLHCLAGLGRSGLVAACVLTQRGMSAAEAIASVREHRDPRAVESEDQEAFVGEYASALPQSG